METVSELVIAARDGQREAFDRLVERFQAMAYTGAYAVVNDTQLAEDVAQEAFLEAYLNLPRLREPAAFPGWFRRIIFKQGDRLTRGKHHSLQPLETACEIALDGLNPAEIIEQRERQRQVQQVVTGLPEHERIVILLFYGTGYPLKDIAAFLEVPVTTVKKRLHDARKRLKEGLLERTHDFMHEQSQTHTSHLSDKVRLLMAAHTGNLTEARTLLDAHPLLVNVKLAGDERLVKEQPWLISSQTPLYEAVEQGNVAMINLLLDYGAAIYKEGSLNVLNTAIFHRRHEVAQLLLQRGANPGGYSSSHTPPLHVAAMKGDVSMLELLLAYGAYINQVGPSGRTALHWAALKGHSACVSFLLQHGADKAARDELGRTALDWARTRGQLTIIELLQH